jgi:hypothetical protein
MSNTNYTDRTDRPIVPHAALYTLLTETLCGALGVFFGAVIWFASGGH